MTSVIPGFPRGLALNAASLIGGRVLLSLGRLVAALMIVRVLGADRFGEYVLVLQFVFLFEWLADFGQTDVAVRDISRAPEREPGMLGALAALKAVHGTALALLLPLLLLAMQYPAHIVRAGVAGGLSVACYAAVQVLRTRMRVRMRVERDVAAEVGSLLVLLPLTWWACRAGAGVEVLVGCYAVARLAFLAFLVGFEGGVPRGARPSAGRVRGLLAAALPLGAAGLLVSLYDSLATLMLSKLATLEAVAQYAAATRWVFPVIIAVQALGSAFLPPLSAAWEAAPDRFRELQQASLDLSVLMGGGLFCAVFAGAEFLMGLMGPAIGAAAPVLQAMSVVVLARAVTTAMSPLIVVAGRQGSALWLTGLSIVLQAAALLLLVPRYGLLGAALGYLLVELLVGVVPVSVLGQHVARVRLRWAVPARLIGCAAVAVSLAGLAPLDGTVWSGVLGGVLYAGLVLGTGTITPGQVRSVLSQASPAASPARGGAVLRATPGLAGGGGA